MSGPTPATKIDRIPLLEGANANNLIDITCVAMRQQGMSFFRATILPNDDGPATLVVEGWIKQPEDQGPAPTE